MSLFKDGLMRTAAKSSLKPFLRNGTSSIEPKTGARKFYKETFPEEIKNATIRFFELLHSPSDLLYVIRKSKYEQMVLSNRANIDPSTLPPSPREAYFHELRV